MDLISGLGLLAIILSPPFIVLWRIEANEQAGRDDRAAAWRMGGVAAFLSLCVWLGCHTNPDSADVFPGDVTSR